MSGARRLVVRGVFWGSFRYPAFRSTHLGSQLNMQVHVALSSREVEVEYLEDLTDRILPLVNKVG